MTDKAANEHVRKRPKRVSHLLAPGITKTYHGYARYFRKGPHQWKLVHRKLVEDLIIEQRRNAIASLLQTDPDYREFFEGWLVERESALKPLPLHLEVHHADFNKLHNCPGNFIVMEDVLHRPTASEGQPRVERGKFTNWKRRGNT